MVGASSHTTMDNSSLPVNLDAERATLGSCLLDREAILLTRDLVAVADFYLEKHAWVYEAILECLVDKVPPDITTVGDRLRRKERLDPIGGYMFLGELTQAVPTSIHADHYARIVARTAAKRRLIELGAQISAAAYDDRLEPEDLYEEASRRLQLERTISTGREGWRDRVEDGLTLWGAKFPPAHFIVEQILPEGTFLLAGKPKTKKSWFAMNIAYAVTSGGRALGHFQAMKGDVLYIDLEMGKRRIHRRLKVIYPNNPPPAGVHFADEWPRVWEGFEEHLDSYLKARPYTRLIIVDTLIAIRPPMPRGGDAYEHDKAYTQTLSSFCQGRGIAMILIHHARKADASDLVDLASGTSGLTGGVDNVAVLQPGDGKADGVLGMRGRDIETDDDVNLKWDARLAQWNRVEESATLTPERRAVLKLLSGRPGLSSKEIALILSRPEPGTRRLLSEMKEAGLIDNAQGCYFPKDDPTLSA